MDEEEKVENPVEENYTEETTQDKKSETAKKVAEEANKIKDETKETVNQVKETLKNTDFKKDASETKGFVKEMFANPIEAVKRAASEENIFGKVVILMIVFLAASLLGTLVSRRSYYGLGGIIKSVVLSILLPLVNVIAYSLSGFVLQGSNKKKLTTVISTVVVAYVPIICTYIIDILENLVSEVTLVTSPISLALKAVSVVLGYFGFKELTNEENGGKALRKYAVIIFVAQLIIRVVSRILY